MATKMLERTKYVLVLLLSLMSLQLKAAMTLTADADTLCGGSGLVLTLTGNNPFSMFRYQVKYDTDEEWENAFSSDVFETTFADNMADNHDSVFYRVMDVYGHNYSNTVKIIRDNSDKCHKTCHASTTGDEFIMGTDFDPKDGTASPTVPDGVITYFDEYNLTFAGSDNDKYTVTAGLDPNLFGGMQPRKDAGVTNYYYSYNSAVGNSIPFKIGFPKEIYAGQHYRFHMRAYIKAKEGCNQWQSSSVKARTYHGTVTHDTLEVFLYNDTQDTLIGSAVNGSEVANITLSSILPADKLTNYPDLIRLEMYFYGTFPNKKQEDFLFTPMLEQFDCGYVAIDFISADVESVCLTDGTVCKGKSSSVNATGFARSAVYHWDELDEDGNWQPLVIDGVTMIGKDYSTISIPVTKVGRTRYRVWDSANIETYTTDSYYDYSTMPPTFVPASSGLDTTILTFSIVGNSCEPSSPDTISGDKLICAPTDTVIYEPFPYVSDPAYYYAWTLLDPDGNKFENDTVAFYAASDKKKWAIKYSDAMKPGKYLLIVQLVKNELNQNIGDPDTLEIQVYQRPKSAFEVTKGGGATTICPYSSDVQFSAKEVNDKYTYTWINATATEENKAVANVTVPANHCELEKFNAGLIVAITENMSCADTSYESFDLDKSQPVVDCDALGGNREFFLDSTANEIEVVLPTPVITATCDGDPTVEIVGKGYRSDSTEFTFSITSKYSDIVSGTTSMVKSFPATAGKKGENGIRVTYVAKDGCGKPSDTCAFNVVIRDTFPPRIDCNKIPNYTDSLSHYPYDQCVATPGEGNPLILPVLTAPSLEDTLHKGTFITGVYSGRSDGAENLNDPFTVGTTTVKWTFADASGNESYCYQSITVIDDKKPEVSCPDLNKFRVHPDSTECELSAEGLVKQIREQLGTDLPTATDRCEGGVTLEPTYYYQVDGDADWTPLNDTTKFRLKVNYNFQWRFYKPKKDAVDTTVYVFCQESFNVIDNKTPYFDCNSIADVTTDTAPKGKCEAEVSNLLRLFNPWPTAIEVCTLDSIKGVITLPDGSPLPATIPVGDTIDVIWTFANSDLTDSVKICDKKLYVVAQSEPIFDCNSLPDPLIGYSEEGKCTANLKHILDQLSPWPTATDSCTGKQIPGVVTMEDGSPLADSIPVGDTVVVRWMFSDPTVSIGVKYCYQKVYARSHATPVFDCNSLPDPLIGYAEEGKCTANLKHILDQLDPWPTATDSCTGRKIPGVVSMEDGSPLVDSIPVGDTIVVRWTFSDTTLTTGVKYCYEKVYARSQATPIFDCSKLGLIVDTTAKGSCSVNMEHLLDLVKPWPVATDSCTGHEIPGVPTQTDGSALPTTLSVGDTLDILWTFADSSYTNKVKYCHQLATVIGSNEVLFDCSKLDTLRFPTETGECYAIIKNGDIPIPVGLDSCTGAEVPGIPSRADGGEVYGSYNVGVTELIWRFISPYSIDTTKTCTQQVLVKTDKKVDAHCGKENFPDLTYTVSNESCEITGDSILAKLADHYGDNPCIDSVKIKGVATRADGKSLDDPYRVGTTTIIWTFTDTTNTLQDPVSQCEQLVIVDNGNVPPIDCENSFPSVTLQMDTADCGVDFSKIPVYIDHIPVNPCNNDTAKVDTSRSDGKDMHDLYTLGVTNITWRFTYQSTGKYTECYQRVNIIDTVAPYFDCSVLKDITVEVKDSLKKGVTYAQLVDSGLYIPKAVDRCGNPITTYRRSDGRALEDNYYYNEVTKSGVTTITWIFTDENGNSDSCLQNIIVTDLIPAEPTCPDMSNKGLKCVYDVPAAFANYEEFHAAGGSYNPIDRVVLSTFGHMDVTVGDSCAATVSRQYYILGINGDTVYCTTPDTFVYVDDIAPEYVGINPNGVEITTSCDKFVDNPPVVSIVDNCDPNPTMTKTRVSTQGDDPSKCSYYTYDVTYTWTAVDRCGNAATPVNYLVHVKDTVAPDVHLPENWSDPSHPIYLGKCQFGVPQITIPKDSIYQNCGDVDNITIWQEPAAGSLITQTTIVYVHVMDVCGNDTVLEKTVLVEEKQDIVKIDKHDAIFCGDDASWANPKSATNSLANSSVHTAWGRHWEYDDRLDEWASVTTNSVWDYYRGTLDADHVVYSNNPWTYKSRFASTEPNTEAGRMAFGKCVLLTRRSQSDTYWYVATDTVTGCADTVSVYIEVRERPRIRMATAPFSLCDGDSLSVSGEFGDANPVCIDEMGSPVTAEGWLLNGSVYKLQSPVYYADGAVQKAVYYATNECGTSTSENTLFTSCLPLATAHDSLMAVNGSASKYALMQQDSLYTVDSVKINIYTKYNPAQVLLTTKPQDKARVWPGDEVKLTVTMPYQPAYVAWMRVEGDYDAEGNAVYDRNGNVVVGGSGEDDDVNLDIEEALNADSTSADTTARITYTSNYKVTVPSDSSLYYVVVGNGVCPTVSSNLVEVDYLTKIPTAITPYTKDGMNDDFMRGHHVTIFSRYGGLLYEGNDGWDGTFRGLLADPAVYFYTVDMADGSVYKGSIEVVKTK